MVRGGWVVKESFQKHLEMGAKIVRRRERVESVSPLLPSSKNFNCMPDVSQ